MITMECWTLARRVRHDHSRTGKPPRRSMPELPQSNSDTENREHHKTATVKQLLVRSVAGKDLDSLHGDRDIQNDTWVALWLGCSERHKGCMADAPDAADDVVEGSNMSETTLFSQVSQQKWWHQKQHM